MVNSTNDTDELATVKCIREISKAMAMAVGSSTLSPLDQFLSLLTKTCLDNIVDSELKYAKQCGKILLAATSSCSAACHFVLTTTLNPILDQYSKQDTSAKKTTLMVILLDILLACRLISTKPSKVLLASKDRILELFITTLMDATYTPLRQSCISGLVELIMSQILTDYENEVCMKHLNRLCFDPVIEVKTHVIKLMVQASWHLPELVLHHSLPDLMASLGESKNREAVLGVIVSISVNDFICSVIVPRLVESVVGNVKADVLDALNRILDARAEYEVKNQDSKKILSHFTVGIVLRILRGQFINAIIEDDKMMSSFGKCISTIMMNITSKEQTELCDIIMTFNLGKTGSITPLDLSMTLLYKCSLCYIRAETKFGVPNVSEYLNELISKAYQSGNTRFCIAIGKIIASLMNKKFNYEEVDGFVSLIKSKYFDGIIMDEARDAKMRNNLLLMYSWLAKGCILQANPLGYEMASAILEFVSHPILCDTAVNGFEIIMKDDESFVLTKKSFAKQRILYKQKFYNHSLPLISKGFENSKEYKPQYLKVLSHLLRNISHKSLITELPKLFPMLILSLQSDDNELKLATLTTIAFMVKESPNLIISQLTSILANLFTLSSHQNKELDSSLVF